MLERLATRLVPCLAALSLAAPLGAQGLGLVRTGGAIGTPLVYQIQGDPFEIWAVLPSFNQGPTPMSFFDPADPRILSVGVDGLAFIKAGPISGLGQGQANYALPLNPALQGKALHAQCVSLFGTGTLVDDISNATGFALGLPGTSNFTLNQQPEDPDGNTATLLANGKVLFAGGTITDPQTFVLLASDLLTVFDPQTQRFTTAAQMSVTRSGHTATRLADGRVLLLGGFDSNYQVHASGDIWDPVTNQVAPIAPMASARTQHSATLLANGRVFVAGGVSSFDVTDPIGTVNSALKSSATYNPATNTWAAGPDLPKARLWQGASLLSDGRVLLTGGVEMTQILIILIPGISSDCRRYDPVTNTFLATPAFSGARATHAQVRLANGNAAIFGGADGDLIAQVVNPLASTRVYDVATNSWTNTAPMANLRARCHALQGGGKIFMVGGVSTFDLATQTGTSVPDIESSDETLGAWTTLGSTIYPRQLALGAAIENGARIVIGGTADAGSGASLPDHTAEVFIP